MDSADSPIDDMHTGPGPARRQVTWRASALALFLPTVVVAAGYGGLWLALSLAGRGNGAFARVCLMVLVIGVPCLLAYAGLRLSTTRLALRGAHLEAHPGFPVRDPVIVAYAAVSGLSLRRGLSGWITGAGSLVIERDTQAPLVVPGLANPDAALAAVSERVAALAARASRD
tara:strand:+ start:4066 stop:4581 length:516 start_codon:yes stop_codon:yes gene_type:complete